MQGQSLTTSPASSFTSLSTSFMLGALRSSLARHSSSLRHEKSFNSPSLQQLQQCMRDRRRLHTASATRVGVAPSGTLAIQNASGGGSAFAENHQQSLDQSGGLHALPAASTTYIGHLEIRNLALIAHQSIELHPGLNVISGESGAGKSMVIQALGAVLGAPAGEDIVRTGESSCIVEARLNLSHAAQVTMLQLLTGLGLPKRALPVAKPDGACNLQLRREIRREGSTMRSRCAVNGVATSLRVLREVASTIVDVNGQNSSLTLRNPETQVAMLDRLAGTGPAAAAFGNTLTKLRDVRSQLAAVDALGDDDYRQKLQDLVDEVRAVGPEEGEERRLRDALRRMEARRFAVEQCQLACTALGSHGGVEGGLVTVEGHLRGVLSQEEKADAQAQEERATRDDSGYDRYQQQEEEEEDNSGAALMCDALDTLEQARQYMAEAEAKVAEYASQYRFSVADKENLSSRLAEIVKCLKEQGVTTTGELLAAAAAAEQDLDSWFQLEGQRGSMEEQAEQLQTQLAAQGASLSQRRRGAAGYLRTAVETALSQLCMAGSRFDVRIGWEALPQVDGGILVGHQAATAAHETGGRSYRAGETGLDSVEFLLAAGPAEPLRALGSVASGGESARIMMALKAAPSAAAAKGHTTSMHSEEEGMGGQPIMVLDEIDSGVGSRLGAPIAQMLRRMAGPGGTAEQILCVSHLPQVAAYAQHHLCVRKHQAADGRMHTSIMPLLTEAERLKEVTEMVGVDDATATASLMLQEAAA